MTQKGENQVVTSQSTAQGYANGYKATLKLGNPLSLDFENVELELRWGPRRPDDGFKTVSYADWNKQFHTGKQTISRRLRAGSWNPIEVVLAPATAEHVGSIEVTGIKTSKVFMAAR